MTTPISPEGTVGGGCTYDRKIILLNAAFNLLKKQKDAHYVLDLLSETVFYDGADCDGSCLMEDIENEINRAPEATLPALKQRVEELEKMLADTEDAHTPLAMKPVSQAVWLQALARKYFAEEVASLEGRTGSFPAGGYVVLFNGTPCGWMCSLECDKAENGRLTHRPGCVAVAIDGAAQVWDAIGGDYQGGAEKWEPRINPIT